MTIQDLFTDVALASILILIGQLLRSKIKLFQHFFMPASMIAGFIGLIFGPEVLDILPFSKSISSYAGILIIIVFTVIGINGYSPSQSEVGTAKTEINRISSFLLYKLVAFFIQFFVPIAFTLAVLLKFFPDLNPGFGLLLPTGFYGGHGTAAAVGSTFEDLGWESATDLGMTVATIGILTGIFGGLALIKYSAKRGYTSYIQDFKYVSGDLRTGLISKENRKPLGNETISSVSLDTLAFHSALILGIGGLGYFINQWINKNLLSGIPSFTIAFITALIFFFLFRKRSVYNYIDKKINLNIAGTATDYLVFFGIASIKITVIIDYALPLLLLISVGFILVFLTVFPLGYLMNRYSWFERSIFVYGYSTGVFAIGFVLLRIVDPNNRSKTLEDSAITPLTSFLEIIAWSAFPAMLIAGKGWWIVWITLALTIITFIIAIVTKLWWPKIPLNKRESL